MNIFTATGRIGKDAEVKYTAKGTAVAQFSVAVDSGFGDQKKTTWIEGSVFGKRAEGNLPKYLIKGAKIAFSGELGLDEWEHEGKKYSRLKCLISTLDLIGDKSDAGGGNTQQGNGYGNAQSANASQPNLDDDIPF